MANPILQHIGTYGELLHPIEGYLPKDQPNWVSSDTTQTVSESYIQANHWRTDYVDWESLTEVESHAFSTLADAIWDKMEIQQDIVVTRWYEREITIIIGLVLSSILLVLLMAIAFS